MKDKDARQPSRTRASEARSARLEAQLKANLKKRKQQAHARSRQKESAVHDEKP